MALLSAQRKVIFRANKYVDWYIFHISSLLKETSAGGQNRHLFPITFTIYNVDKRLAVELLTAYMKGQPLLEKVQSSCFAM